MTHPTPDELDQHIDQRAGADIDPATREVVDALHTLADHPPLREEFALALERRLLTEAQSLASSMSHGLSPWKWMQLTVVDLVQRLKDPHPNPLPQGEGVKTWPTYVVTALAALAVVVALFFIMRPLTGQLTTTAAPTAIPQAGIRLPLGTPTPAVLGTVAPGQRLPLLATPTPFVPTLVPGPVVFEGRLGARLDRPTEPAAYVMQPCDGSVLPVLENYPGQLTGFVGQVIRVRAQIGGTGVDPTAGVYGPTILSVEAAPDLCPTGTPLPPGQPTPAPTGTPFAYAGHLGPRVDIPESGSGYPISQCGSMTQFLLRELTPGQLEPFVGQDIIVVVSTQWYMPTTLQRAQVGYIALHVQAGKNRCPTPASTDIVVTPALGEATATPLTMQPAPVLFTPTPPQPAPTRAADPMMPTPEPTLWQFEGRLAHKLDGQGGGAIFLLQQCNGLTQQLYETTAGQLDPFLGQEVRGAAQTTSIVTPTTGERGTALRVVSIVLAPGLCPPVGDTPTPASVVTGGPTPPATPAPVIAIGRLGAATRGPDQAVYYAFERCDGTQYRLIEGRPGLFDPLVGQTVQIIAEPRGIPSEPTQAPVLYVFQVDAAPDGCQSPKATPTPVSLTDLHEWRSPDGQWVASVFISQPLRSGPNVGRKPVQFKVRHTDGSREWTIVDDVEQASGWLTPAPQFWTRDGQALLFGLGFEVRRVELTSGKVTTVAQDVARVSQVSPDETRLAYIDWKSRLTVRQLLGEGMQQIQVEGLQDAAHVHDLVWSPDSQAVAFSFPSSTGGNAIVRVDVATLSLRTLAVTTNSPLTLTEWRLPGEITAKDNNGRLSSVNAETGQVTPTN